MKYFSRLLTSLEGIQRALETLVEMEKGRRGVILLPEGTEVDPTSPQVFYGSLPEDEEEKLQRRVAMWREETQNFIDPPPREVVNGNY